MDTLGLIFTACGRLSVRYARRRRGGMKPMSGIMGRGFITLVGDAAAELRDFFNPDLERGTARYLHGQQSPRQHPS
jgi:hypothetical protein